MAVVARGWCYRADARTADGTAVAYGHPEAVAWCVHGAIQLQRGAHPSVLDEAEQAVIDYVGKPIQIWNDRSNQETVLRVLSDIVKQLETA